MSAIATRPTSGPTNQIEVRRRNVIQLFQSRKGDIAAALPKHITPDRMLRVLLTTVNKNPELLHCTDVSLLACMLECSQLGLEPGPLGQAHFVPFQDRRAGETVCTFILGYLGRIELINRSGKAQICPPEIVYENDTFIETLGSHPLIKHERAKGNRGKPIGCYAVGVLLNANGVPIHRYMTAEEIYEHRDRYSKGYQSSKSPWTTDELPMWKKTLVIQVAKWLPKSVEWQRAEAIDAAADAGEPQPLDSYKLLGVPEPEANAYAPFGEPTGKAPPPGYRVAMEQGDEEQAIRLIGGPRFFVAVNPSSGKDEIYRRLQEQGEPTVIPPEQTSPAIQMRDGTAWQTSRSMDRVSSEIAAACKNGATNAT